MGNYYLCEQIKINKNRVNVKDGGLLLELDTYFDEVNRFQSKLFNLPWMVKEPDEENSPGNSSRSSNNGLPTWKPC